MEQLRKKLEDDKAFLARVQRELTEHNKDLPTGSLGVNVWDGPRWQTNPFAAWQAWNSEDQRLRSIKKRWEEKIQNDEKAISDLVEQCRRQKCLPDWVR